MIEIKKCDITRLGCDCIVNAANNSLLGGGGVDGAIHKAAGVELFEECKTLHGCETGDAKITKGYNLKAQYVIHTVGPIYSNAIKDAQTLASCYEKSLSIAKENNIHSIAFPNISTGVYGFPTGEAAAVAITTVKKWLKTNADYNIDVIFACYTQENYDIYNYLIEDVGSK